MNAIKIKETLIYLKRVIMDVLLLNIQAFALAVLLAVCWTNGWFEPQQSISHEDFWNICNSIQVLVPFIVFYRAFRGRYRIEVYRVALKGVGKAECVNEVKEGT